MTEPKKPIETYSRQVFELSQAVGKPNTSEGTVRELAKAIRQEALGHSAATASKMLASPNVAET